MKRDRIAAIADTQRHVVNPRAICNIVMIRDYKRFLTSDQLRKYVRVLVRLFIYL